MACFIQGVFFIRTKWSTNRTSDLQKKNGWHFKKSVVIVDSTNFVSQFRVFRDPHQPHSVQLLKWATIKRLAVQLKSRSWSPSFDLLFIMANRARWWVSPLSISTISTLLYTFILSNYSLYPIHIVQQSRHFHRSFAIFNLNVNIISVAKPEIFQGESRG